MEKKKAIKIATATAVAASAIIAVTPIESDAATSLTSKMKKAKATMKKPFDTYYLEADDSKPASLSKVKKELAAAQKAKKDIKVAINKSKLSSKQKQKMHSEIGKYDKYLTRTQGYVNAVSINVKAARTSLDHAIKSGKPMNVLAAQTALEKKIKQFEKAVAKVYGQYTRSILTSYYVKPAKKHSSSIAKEMKVYKVYKQIEQEKLISTNLKDANKLIEEVKKEVASLRAKDTPLAKNLIKTVDKINQAYEVAYNEASGIVTTQTMLNKAIANAKDGDKVEIKLKASENLIIETTKALTITLTGELHENDVMINAPNTHVTNKATQAGKITIIDVSNTSYEQVGTYGSLVFNDINGGKLINLSDTPLNVTLGDGAKVTLVGLFGTVTATGTADVTLAANTIVNEIAAERKVNVIAEQGAKVERTTGAGTVTITPSTPTPPPSSNNSGEGGGSGPTPDRTAPVVTAGVINRTSDSEATVKFTSNEAGQYYISVVEKGASPPTINTTGSGIAVTTAETTANVSLTAGAKDVYVVVKDAAGNVSNRVKFEVPAFDQPAPPPATAAEVKVLTDAVATANTLHEWSIRRNRTRPIRSWIKSNIKKGN